MTLEERIRDIYSVLAPIYESGDSHLAHAAGQYLPAFGAYLRRPQDPERIALAEKLYAKCRAWLNSDAVVAFLKARSSPAQEGS